MQSSCHPTSTFSNFQQKSANVLTGSSRQGETQEENVEEEEKVEEEKNVEEEKVRCLGEWEIWR